MRPRHDQKESAEVARRWVRPRKARWKAWEWAVARPGKVSLLSLMIICDGFVMRLDVSKYEV